MADPGSQNNWTAIYIAERSRQKATSQEAVKGC